MDLLVLAAIALVAARGIESIADDVKAKRAATPKGKDVGKNKTPKVDPKVATAAAPKAAKAGAAAAQWAALGVTNARAWGEAARAAYREQYTKSRAEAEQRLRDKADAAAKTDAVEAKARVEPAGKPVESKPAEAPKVDITVTATATAPTPADTEPAPAPAPAPAAEAPGRPRLVVLTNPAAPAPAGTSKNGDTVTPSTAIPEIRTLDGLLAALTMVGAMCIMRAEEAETIAADDHTLANRLDQIEGELTALEVDPATLAEIAELRESIRVQAKAAAVYGAAADEAADLAKATAQAASKGHSGIAEAVQSAPIEQAAQAGYYER